MKHSNGKLNIGKNTGALKWEMKRIRTLWNWNKFEIGINLKLKQIWNWIEIEIINEIEANLCSIFSRKSLELFSVPWIFEMKQSRNWNYIQKNREHERDVLLQKTQHQKISLNSPENSRYFRKTIQFNKKTRNQKLKKIKNSILENIKQHVNMSKQISKA